MTTTHRSNRLYIGAIRSTVSDHGIAAVPSGTYTAEEVAKLFQNCKCMDDGNNLVIYTEQYAHLFEDEGEEKCQKQ